MEVLTPSIIPGDKMEEELTVPEGETQSKEAEYEESEEILISEEAFDTNSLEVLLQITDVWNKALNGQLSLDEATTIIKSISSSIKREKPTRRRRRKSSK